jgi:hypothetical protein
MTAQFTPPLKTEPNKKLLKLIYHKNNICGFTYDNETLSTAVNSFADLPAVGYIKIDREEMHYRYAKIVDSEAAATLDYPYIENPDSSTWPIDGTKKPIVYVTVDRYKVPVTSLSEQLNEGDSSVDVSSTDGMPYEFIALIGSELFRLQKYDRKSFTVIYPVNSVPITPYEFVTPPDPNYYNPDTSFGGRAWKAGTPLSVYSYAPAFPPYTYGAATRAIATLTFLPPSSAWYDINYGEEDKLIRRVYNVIPPVYWDYDTDGSLRKFIDSLAPLIRCFDQDFNLLNDVDYAKAKEAWLPYLIRNMGWEALTEDTDLWRWQARYSYQLFRRKGRIEPLDNIFRLLNVDFQYTEWWRNSIGDLQAYDPEWIDIQKDNDITRDLLYYQGLDHGVSTSYTYNSLIDINKNWTVDEFYDPDDTVYVTDMNGTTFEILSNLSTELVLDNREDLS